MSTNAENSEEHNAKDQRDTQGAETPQEAGHAGQAAEPGQVGQAGAAPEEAHQPEGDSLPEAADAEGSEGASPRRSWSAIPPVAWVTALVLLVLAVAGGYVWGQNTATPTTAQIASHAKAGKATDVPRAKDDGSFDATISGPGREPQNASDVLAVHRRNVSDPMAMGAADAPVVISMFSDYYCPFCLRFNSQVEPQLVKDYVDKGLVRIEWNDVPLHGKDSMAAAKAARAAAAQNKFREYKDALFEKVSTLEKDQKLSKDDYVQLAKDVQVPDVEKFTKDATSDRFEKPIAEAQQYAQSIGISGTPSFFVGTQFVSGAQPAEQFAAVIQQELAKTANGEVQVPEVK
ncbi:thioredoxin domain-containing protein [Corynebacterium uropygiale]|uniref:Thioredoxin domain-containing protein n=1 Tax=Corynebacterium uropygiale TaxID=1775911 RepID=A0A9X1TZJ5_9CORY|nr:thioredoxin domain-containing protein [Corynebacterium uropygiale]MCF4005779.1 thioredoxin domain-containing protein [Corynebacterium uropygiale]